VKSNFDSTVSLELNSILEGEENIGQKHTTGQSKQSSAPEGSREADSSSPNSFPSKKSASHQIAFSSEIPFSKTREVW